MRAELFEYCDKKLVTIKRMRDLEIYFQEAKKSNSKDFIKLNHSKNSHYREDELYYLPRIPKKGRQSRI